MAVRNATTHPFPAQGRVAPTTTTEQIKRYAEVCVLIVGLESEHKAQRVELLNLRAAGAEQDAGSPYLLSFVDQDRRNIGWKALAFGLAEKVFGTAGAATWNTEVEQSAPVQPITQIRVNPNPAYAASLVAPAASQRILPTAIASTHAAVVGD